MGQGNTVQTFSRISLVTVFTIVSKRVKMFKALASEIRSSARSELAFTERFRVVSDVSAAEKMKEETLAVPSA